MDSIKREYVISRYNTGTFKAIAMYETDDSRLKTNVECSEIVKGTFEVKLDKYKYNKKSNEVYKDE